MAQNSSPRQQKSSTKLVSDRPQLNIHGMSPYSSIKNYTDVILSILENRPPADDAIPMNDVKLEPPPCFQQVIIEIILRM